LVSDSIFQKGFNFIETWCEFIAHNIDISTCILLLITISFLKNVKLIKKFFGYGLNDNSSRYQQGSFPFMNLNDEFDAEFNPDSPTKNLISDFNAEDNSM